MLKHDPGGGDVVGRADVVVDLCKLLSHVGQLVLKILIYIVLFNIYHICAYISNRFILYSTYISNLGEPQRSLALSRQGIHQLDIVGEVA